MDYSGLDTELKHVSNQNHSALLDQLQRRFSQTTLDERLVDTPAPKPLMISGKGLLVVLESIDANLKDVGMGDLQSRLVFLSLL